MELYQLKVRVIATISGLLSQLDYWPTIEWNVVLSSVLGMRVVRDK